MQAKYLATLPGYQGDARVYRVTPPMEYSGIGWRRDEPTLHTDYVIVSAADVMFTGPETYIFPAKKAGDTFEPINFLELEGSFRGDLDHEQALANAGYEVC